MIGGAPIRIGVVGLGKIAHDQHLPAIAAHPRFVLTATASPGANVPGIATFETLESMIEGTPDLQAVAICTPPSGRHLIARQAIDHGLATMIEKPPATTLAAAEGLARRASDRGATPFAAWHSREAAGVSIARDWMMARQLRRVRIVWKEDVRIWHPGQEWLWEPGGFGVFDPGINALSILTALLDDLVVEHAHLDFPTNRATPVRAALALSHPDVETITAEFDFLQRGPQSWSIFLDAERETLTLLDGGARVEVDGVPAAVQPTTEYCRLYNHFANLIDTNQSDVDFAPLRLVADAHLLGGRSDAPPIHY